MMPDRQLLECEWLVVRCQQGDSSAFEAIVQMWQRPLFYYLRRMASSEEDAWDWLQETWLKMFRSLGTLRDPRTLPAFLYATARRTAMSRLRSPEYRQPVVEATNEGPADNNNDVVAFEHAEQVHHALDRLPLIHREILTLYFLEDLSLDEMAALLEIPLGTVKSRLHHAKQSIHKLLSEGHRHDS